MPTDASIANLITALKALPKNRRTGATFAVRNGWIAIYDRNGANLADIVTRADGMYTVDIYDAPLSSVRSL